MKITLTWLRDHLDTDADAATVAEALTGLGLEVEGIHDPAAALAAFTVAKIKEAVPHPDADKLRVCTVDTGTETVQVVCGAPNARAGLRGVFAAPGTYVPGLGVTLGKAKIRGVESAGMMCSARELEIGDDHDGIIELSGAPALGSPAAAALGLDDPVLDVAVTPNRGDCLGVQGIARDLAARGLGRLKHYMPAQVKGTFTSPIGIRLDFPADNVACPHFIGRSIRGVRNGESPDWLKRKLQAVGLRPISALVDITNYLLMDRNRPLHVFDAEAIAGDLTIRMSRPGERLTALDGCDYDLGAGAVVIADRDGVLSLGGIMGGESSACTAQTVNVLLEAAYFEPLAIAATGRRLGIESDARYRFERGVDPASALPGIEAATQLVLDLCGGEASAVVVAGAAPQRDTVIEFPSALVARRGGMEIPESRVIEILTALGFEAKPAAGGLSVRVPPWRGDVTMAADLVEEVLRVEGFDAIPSVSLAPTAAITRPVTIPRQRHRGLARRALAARGMAEAVSFSFIGEREAKLFGGGDPSLRLANPISSELTDMRPSLLPALIAAVTRNAARGLGDTALFEVGPAYADATPAGQSFVADGIRTGSFGPRHWAERPRPVDTFDAKADALAALAECGAPVASLQTFAEAPSWYHPGRAGTLRLGPKTILAAFGEVHPGVLAAMDAAGPMVGFEVFLDAIPEPRDRGSRARPPLDLSPFQPVSRDFAFIVDDSVAGEALIRAVRGADRTLIVDATVFDVYHGKGVPEGKVSIALAVTLQPVKATLTDAEIEAVAKKVVAAAEKAVGATLRA
ncbi:MAG: phenylalanine--tRNA ligase subunit beta [Alphaproteobacteria bacterium]|nr:phenylalanine--tRNA ligase subunit beta [Alphaproteobacteria bacterium]